MSPSKKVKSTQKSGKSPNHKVDGTNKKRQSSKKEARDSAIIRQPARAEKQNIWFTNILRVLALLAVIGITVYIFGIRERVRDYAEFGYPGIFLIALMANATVLLPAPGVAIIFAMGSIFNPLGVALAAGTGGALGELSGYLAGFSGQAVVEHTKLFDRIKPWVEKYGGWTILAMSAIPNPFFDVAGIAAGMVKMPMQKFLAFTWFGQLIKMAMFAYAGKYSVDWIGNLIR